VKRLALLFVLLVLTMACGTRTSQPSLLSGPTPIDAAVVVLDAYTFDATQLGRMTLTNTHATATDYTFIVWRSLADDGLGNKGQASYRLLPGETRVLTVGVQEECGARYQRNVFVGIAAKPDENPFTMSDLRNYPLYSPGGLWIEPACDASPVVIPPPPPVVIPPPPPPPVGCNFNGVQPVPCPNP
jgi:hypothetical protein